MLKNLLRYAETVVDEDKGQVTAVLTTKKLTRTQILFCVGKDDYSRAMAEYFILKRPSFVAKAKLKEGDTCDTNMAIKIANTKLERQFNKYMIQVLVESSRDLLTKVEGCFEQAYKLNKDVENCTFHIIGLQLPKDIGPVDIDISESRSATAKHLLSSPRFVDFVRAIVGQRDDRIACRARRKKEKKMNSDPNSAAD